jgi:hypothetical protein
MTGTLPWSFRGVGPGDRGAARHLQLRPERGQGLSQDGVTGITNLCLSEELPSNRIAQELRLLRQVARNRKVELREIRRAESPRGARSPSGIVFREVAVIDVAGIAAEHWPKTANLIRFVDRIAPARSWVLPLLAQLTSRGQKTRVRRLDRPVDRRANDVDV